MTDGVLKNEKPDDVVGNVGAVDVKALVSYGLL